MKKRVKHYFWTTWLFSITIPLLSVLTYSQGEAEQTPKPSTRVISVTAYAADEFAEIVNWQWFVKDHFIAVSAFFDSLFGIQFEVVDCKLWLSGKSARDLLDLMNDLKDQCIEDTSDIVIGFSFQPPGTGTSFTQPDLDVGYGEVFGRVAILRCALSELLNWSYIDFLLIHELSHLFGAFHCEDTMSIMRTFSDGVLPKRKLDPQTIQLITRMKDFDFKQGVLSLDTAHQKVIRDIFQSGHAEGEQNPIASALLILAKGYIARGKLDSASLMYHITLPHCDTTSIANLITFAQVLQVTGHHNSALEILARLSLVDLQEARELNNLAMLYLLCDKPEAADSALNRALEIDPVYVNALWGKALALIDLADTSEALVFVDSTITIDPSHTLAKAMRDSILALYTK